MFENLKKFGCDGDCGSCGSEPGTCGEKPEPSTCSHDCGSCPSGGSCGEFDPKALLAEPNPESDVKKVIAVVSGKGGVGKSLVTSLMATTMQRRGYKVAVMDADVTGPSIPKEFGIVEKASADDKGIIPLPTKTGIKTISVNNLLEDDTDPVLWRGPVIAGLVKQFWTDVCWGDVDYMFVDMPPGTGDVPLTVFQSLPVDGIIVVTSPQDLVAMVVSKAIKMAEMMNVPVLGLVENYSYFKCPDCGKETQIFGPSKVDDVAKDFGLDVLAKLPIDPKLAALCDRGMIEMFEGDWLDAAAEKLEK
ncbi:MAG: Mrp/NBP35 family ATP-binding protein [Clostridiales bacterium]|nr:Mrp/NBP35 family ATP-binding protein [Clostridiales bacterium]